MDYNRQYEPMLAPPGDDAMDENELLTVDELIKMAEAYLDLISKYDPPGRDRTEARDVERTWATIAHAAAATAQAKLMRFVSGPEGGMVSVGVYRQDW